MARQNRKTTEKKVNKSGDKRGMLSNSVYFKAGESGNPNGRPKGRRNIQTIYRLAFERIGEAKGMEADDVELAIAIKAVEKAIKGDFKFSEDIQDRLHGKAVQTNLNKDITDNEIDESELDTLDAMLAKFVKVKKKTTVKKSNKK